MMEMEKASVNNSDADGRPVVSEPTKYIVRCCELRKRRMVRSAPVRPRVRIHAPN